MTIIEVLSLRFVGHFPYIISRFIIVTDEPIIEEGTSVSMCPQSGLLFLFYYYYFLSLKSHGSLQVK